MSTRKEGYRSGEIWVTKFDEAHAHKFREEVLLACKTYDVNTPISIYIDSYGGYVDSLAKMIETLDEVKNPIITICMGKAMSCGAILLSHGDLRYCGKHSRIMLHEVSSGAHGDVHDVYADAIETKRLNKHFLGLLADNCGISGGYSGLRTMIKKRDGRDVYLDAASAVEFGIVDKVGVPEIAPIILHEILDVKKRKNVFSSQKTKTKRKKRKLKRRVKR